MATEDITAAASGQAVGKAGLFLRKSSGLIRAFSPFDAFAYNIYAVSIIVAAAFSYAIALAMARCKYTFGNHIQLRWAYTDVHRLCNARHNYAEGRWRLYVAKPSIRWTVGYVLGFLIPVFGTTFFIAGNVAPGPGMVMSPTFLALGKIFNIPALITFASWLSTTVGTWWFYVFYCSLRSRSFDPWHAFLCQIPKVVVYYRLRCYSNMGRDLVSTPREHRLRAPLVTLCRQHSTGVMAMHIKKYYRWPKRTVLMGFQHQKHRSGAAS